MTHSFAARARDADTPEVRERTKGILAAKIEARGFHWTEAGGSDDKAGIDVFATLPNGKDVGVDVKNNRWGEVRLEYVSRAGEGVVGWTINDTYRTDYVLNLWPNYYWLIDFPCLKAVAKEHRDDYAKWYGPQTTSSRSATSNWETRFIPVPVGRLLFDIYGQTVMGTPLTKPRKCLTCHELHPVGTTCGPDGWAPWPLS